MLTSANAIAWHPAPYGLDLDGQRSPLAVGQTVDALQNILHTHELRRCRKGTAMQLRRLAGCSGGSCPAVYETDRGTYVVQGAIVTDGEALAGVNLPATETLVEVPMELLTELKV